MIGSTTVKRSKKREMPKQPTPVRVVDVVVSTTLMTVTFDQPVVLKGTPNWATDVAGATAVSATSPSPAVVRITFSATIAAATTVTIPVADPAIRNMVGGFVADTTFPPCEPAPPQTPPLLVSAVYTIASETLVLEFDQAMDETSLPASSGNLIELNAEHVDRNCRPTIAWLDATHLSLTTISAAISVPSDTTRCADTSGIVAVDGVTQAASWDEFVLAIV